jgi:hypothetical protein
MRGFGWVFVVGLYASSADQNVESVVSCQEVNYMIASDGHLFACDSQQFGNRPITTTKSTPWATRRVQRQCLQIYQTPLFGGTQYRWWCVLPLLTTIHFNCSNSLKLTLALDSCQALQTSILSACGNECFFGTRLTQHRRPLVTKLHESSYICLHNYDHNSQQPCPSTSLSLKIHKEILTRTIGDPTALVSSTTQFFLDQ